MQLDDGRSLEGDVVIGADGNFSFARRYVEPAAQPYAWGMVRVEAYRGSSVCKVIVVMSWKRY